jgi:hypothetical protein
MFAIGIRLCKHTQIYQRIMLEKYTWFEKQNVEKIKKIKKSKNQKIKHKCFILIKSISSKKNICIINFFFK